MLTYQIRGTDRLLNSLDRLELSLKDFRPLFNEASRLIYEFEKEAFASEGASSRVGKWKPLTANYARWKEKKAPGKPILEFSGALKRSLTRPNARGSVRRITEEELIVGTQIPYAVFHQTGTRKMVA
ncbi:MAG TPA: phage virion morphogenesis protein, partial [Blastocatellia bacterium]|nr:phage virion morphogenesis protein [Blastocatellia bacterium]